jgi:glucan 1,3-beta-glucosidase
VGSANTLSVSLKNTGNSNITVSGVSVTATDVTAGGGVSGATLTPGQTATLSVTFAPKQAETVSGTIKISSNVTGSPTSLAVAGTGVAGTGRSVALNWLASTSSNVSGYNVYRATGLTGAYTKLTAAPVSGLKFTDTSAVSGETYVYVVTAVNSSGVESPYSTPATAVIP